MTFRSYEWQQEWQHDHLRCKGEADVVIGSKSETSGVGDEVG